jgi:predicted nucleotidyltransferase
MSCRISSKKLNNPLSNNKDADDMAFILENYLEINQQRTIENYYDEIYNVDDFDTFIASATLIGKDIKHLFEDNRKALNIFSEILKNELNKEEESQLLNQMLATHNSLKYEQVYNALQIINNELKS